MEQRLTFRRITELDFWVGAENAERYRRRKRRGTRAPLDLSDRARCCVALAVATYVACAGGGALVRSTSVGLRSAGFLVVAVVIWGGMAAIRYIRLPVDDQLFDR